MSKVNANATKVAKLYKQSQERAKTGVKRGEGKSVTDKQLAVKIQRLVNADPTISMNKAEQISYWVWELSVGVARFNRVFAEVTGTVAQAA